MSTATVTPPVTTPTPAPEVTMQNTAAEIQAAHTAEKNAAPPVEATPVTPPVVEAPKPYTVVKNDDGSVNVQFSEGGENFTGTYEQVLDKIAASKAEGNRYIKELKGNQPQAATPAATTQTPTTPQTWMPAPEVAVSAVNDMISNGNFGGAVGIGLAQMFGANDPNQVVSAITELLQLNGELKAQRAISDFAAKAPDFPWSDENGKLLVTELTNRGMAMTTDNMVFAYHALKGAERLQATAGAPATAQTPNPAPPRQGQAPQVNGDYNPWTVPLADLEANIRSGR